MIGISKRVCAGAVAVLLAACANGDIGPNAQRAEVTGRVVATRDMSMMIGDVEVGVTVYTLGVSGRPDERILFIIGERAECPAPLAKGRLYHLFLDRVRIVFALYGSEPEENLPDLAASKCVALNG